jgi:hypothetical protein
METTMRKLLIAALAPALSTAALAEDTMIGAGISGMFKPAGGASISCMLLLGSSIDGMRS